MNRLLVFLLCICAALASAAQKGRIEKTAVELETTEKGWRLERSYDLVNGREAAFKELIPSGRVLVNAQIPHIAGINGDQLLRIEVPSQIDTLKASAVITNFADDIRRSFGISYSLDGITYTSIVQGSAAGGDCRLDADLRLPANQGILFLKFCRHLNADDRNGKYGNVLWGKIAFSLTGRNESLHRKPPRAKPLKEVFPTGVFWPWERTAPCAEYAKMELWDFVEKEMRLLADNGYDTVWFVNISTANMQKVLSLAPKHGLRALMNTGLLDAVYSGAGSMESLERRAWETYKSIGSSDALLAYVGKDEPLLCDVENMETFGRLMKEVDPLRDSIVCTMNRQTLTYARDTTLPVICADLYYFGSEKSTQLPHSKDSQPDLTAAIKTYCLAAHIYKKHFWFMGQMFGDVWGRHWRRGSRLVVEPGSYLHWKMPTDAEARWQIWESLRLGAKGILFYVLFPPIQLEVPPSQAKEQWQLRRIKGMDSLAAMAASWKNQPLVENELELDAGEGMVDMDGSPRPQMLATRPAMELIRANEKLLLDRTFCPVPIFFPGDQDTDTMTFESQGRLIGVIVNRDLRNSRRAKVVLPYNVTELRDLATGELLALDALSDEFKETTLPLLPGGGALLEARTEGRAGICICKEDFGRQTLLRVKVADNAKVKRLGKYGADFRFVLRPADDAAERALPACILPRLTNSKDNTRTVAMNLNQRRRDGVIFCRVEGRLSSCKVVAVSDDAEGEKANFLHLKETGNHEAAPSGNGIVIQSRDFRIPAVVPVGTASLEFFLGSPDDYISEIRLWFVPPISPASHL